MIDIIFIIVFFIAIESCNLNAKEALATMAAGANWVFERLTAMD
jgi:hypothetical protein